MISELGKYIKNVNNTDVIFCVTRVKKTQKGFHLSGYWLCVGVVNDWLIDRDEIYIPRHKLSSWRQYTPKEFK
jgi:hypothetical protein